MTTLPTLLLIAGGPGGGKTQIGREVARRLPEAVLLDKDILFAQWVDAMLLKAGAGEIDRDSRYYWDNIRPLEYSALLATALDNLALGKSVVAVAPFGPELRDSSWREGLCASASKCGGRVRTVWIMTDAITAHARMVTRSEARDEWKLAHWDQFLEHARFDPPSDNMLVVHNAGPVLVSDLATEIIHFLTT